MASTLPEPGGEAELRRFVGELLSEPLDSSRPLWDAWFVEGVDDDRGHSCFGSTMCWPMACRCSTLRCC
ncbi:MAG: hypothetical protein IPI82_03625 [Candidatus Microthrix sp.]|nr:hypothetical protein [Candidatus Microthrix sp.]